MIRNFWQYIISFDWVFGMILILIFGVSRFSAVLYGIQSGNNQYLSIIFILMILTPIIFLNRNGRRYIGIRKPGNGIWLFYSFCFGILMSSIVFILGKILYQNSLSNWFVYIGDSYPIDLTHIPKDEKLIYFIIFSLIGITFSPFGEELLYRGIVHGSFISKFGEQKAAIIDSAAFGLTHLAHFGIIYSNKEWHFLLTPAIIWVILMFITGIVFNICKSRADSIWGAVISHIGFNIAMTYYIFYHLF